MKIIKIYFIILITLMCYSCRTEDNSKDFILNNLHKIYKIDDNLYKIDNINHYYKDLTIKINSENDYYIIFWGDRESILWNFKKDFHFSTDIKYNKYKGINTDKDIQIINYLKQYEK